MDHDRLERAALVLGFAFGRLLKMLVLALVIAIGILIARSVV